MVKTKAKQYRITSIQDVINAVDGKNLDNFLVDFKSFLQFAIKLKQQGGEVQTSNFVWIDDGKHDANIRVKQVLKI